MSGPSPYNALYEIFGHGWENKKEDHQQHIKIIKKSAKKHKYTSKKPMKIDNACQTQPLRDYSYNKVVQPTERRVSKKIVEKDVTIKDNNDAILLTNNKEYKKQHSSSIGMHLKRSQVNAVYKTISDIEKLFREEHGLHLHSRKCLCNSCGTLRVITESMKHPVDFGDDTTETEEESEDDDDADDDDEEDEEEDPYFIIPPRYNSSKRSWKIEYKDSETIRHGPTNEGYIRLLLELEKMIKRVRSLEEIALKHNIPLKSKKVDIAYDLQTNRLKNNQLRKAGHSSSSSSDIDKRQCGLFLIPNVIKRRFSKKKCVVEKPDTNAPPNLRSKNYKFKQNDNVMKNTYIEIDKKYQSKCLDEKIQNFDLSLLNEDEICELMYHLKNKAKHTNQRTLTANGIAPIGRLPNQKPESIKHQLNDIHKYEHTPNQKPVSIKHQLNDIHNHEHTPNQKQVSIKHKLNHIHKHEHTPNQKPESIKHKLNHIHKHEHTPFKLSSSPVGLRTVNNNGIHKSLRNDATFIRQSHNYEDHDTETNKNSRNLFKDYLKINDVTPAEQHNERNIKQLRQNSLLKDSNGSSSILYNINTGNQTQNNTGCELNANIIENEQKNVKMKTSKHCNKEWINGIISKSIGVIEENYNHEMKISDNSIKSKIGKTVTYSKLNKYHYFKDRSMDIQYDPNIFYRPIEIGQPSGLCQQRHQVLQDKSSDESSESQIYTKENVSATELECNKMVKNSSQSSTIKSNNTMLSENQDENKVIEDHNQINYQPEGRPLRSELRAQNRNTICIDYDEKISEFISNNLFPKLANEVEDSDNFIIHLRSSLNEDVISVENAENKSSIEIPQKNEETIEMKSPENNTSQVQTSQTSIKKKTVRSSKIATKKENKGIQVTDINKNEENKTASKNMDKKIQTTKEIMKISKACEANLNKEVRKRTITKETKEVQVKEEEIQPKNILINVNKPTKVVENCDRKKTNKNESETDKTKSVLDKRDYCRKKYEKLNISESSEIMSNISNSNIKGIDTKETSNLPKIEKKVSINHKDFCRKCNRKTNSSKRPECKSNMINDNLKGLNTKETRDVSKNVEHKCVVENRDSYRKNNEKPISSNRPEFKSNINPGSTKNKIQFSDIIEEKLYGTETKDENDKIFANRNKTNKELRNEQITVKGKFKNNECGNSCIMCEDIKKEIQMTEINEENEDIIEEIYECPLSFIYNNVPSFNLTNGNSVPPAKKSILRTYKRAIYNSPLKLDKRNSIVINKFKKQVNIRAVKKVSSSMIHDLFNRKSGDLALTKVFKRQKHIKKDEKIKALPSKIPLPIHHEKKANNSNNSSNVSKIPIYKNKPQKDPNVKNNITLSAPQKKCDQMHKNIFLHYNVQNKAPTLKLTKEKNDIRKSQSTNNVKPKPILSKGKNNSKIPTLQTKQNIKQRKKEGNKQLTLSTLCNNNLLHNDKNDGKLPSMNKTSNGLLTFPKNMQLYQAFLPVHCPNMTKKVGNQTILPVPMSFKILKAQVEKAELKSPGDSKKLINDVQINKESSMMKESILPVDCHNNSHMEKVECKPISENTDEAKIFSVDSNILNSYNSQIEKVKNKKNASTTNTHKILPVDSDIINSYNSQIEKVERKLAESADDDKNSSYPTTESFFLPNDATEENSFYAPSPCATEAYESSSTFSDGSNGAVFLYKSKCKLGTDNSIEGSEFDTRISESVYTSTSDLNSVRNKQKWKWLKKFGSRFKSFLSVHTPKSTSRKNSLANGNTSCNAFSSIDTANTNVPIKRKQWKKFKKCNIAKLKSLPKASSLSFTLSVKKKKQSP